MVLSSSYQLWSRSLNLTLHFTLPSRPQPNPTQVFPFACHVELQPSLMLNPTRQSAPCAFRCWGGASVRRLTIASSHCRYDVVTLGAPTCPCHRPDVTMVPATGAACRVTFADMPEDADMTRLLHALSVWTLLPVAWQTAVCCHWLCEGLIGVMFVTQDFAVVNNCWVWVLQEVLSDWCWQGQIRRVYFSVSSAVECVRDCFALFVKQAP